MHPPEPGSRNPCGQQQWFVTTHWSVVLAAADGSSPGARDALENLCRAYWQPLYSFIRRLGHSPADAQDLTQTFLANLMARDSLANVSPERGRFRSFLLASLKYFLADEWDRSQALKRGGGAPIISLDAHQAEEHYAMEPVDENDPEKIFERRWALTVLERTLERLETEMVGGGKKELWGEVKGYLLDDSDSPSYAELASRLDLSISAVKMLVLRLRRRYGELLRAEIAATVGLEGDVEEELRHLLMAVRR